LLWDVVQRNKIAINLLLNNGAKPDFKKDGCLTALQLAEWIGDNTILKLLQSVNWK